jgi:hypothetical protein
VISLGANTANQLGLTDAELDRITAATVHIGNAANTGGIHFTGAIDAENHYATLSLETGGAITDDNFGVDPVVTNLAMRAGTTIGIGGGFGNICTQVTNLAFSAGGAVGIAQINIPLTIAAVDGLTASSGGGAVSVFNAGGGSITVATNVTSGGNLLLEADDLSSAGQDLTVNAGVTLMATGALTLNAGDNLTVNAGATLNATGAITLNGDFGNADGGVGSNVTFQGDVTAAAAMTINGGNDPDTFFVRPSAVVAIAVNGGAPVTLPGDSLHLDLSAGATLAAGDFTGVPITSPAGTYAFTNRQNVTFTSIETLTPYAEIDQVPTPTNMAVTSITIRFTEPVSGFAMSSLSLTLNGSPIGLNPRTNRLTTSDGGRTWVLTLNAGQTSTTGTYTLKLTAAGSGIKSVSIGTPLLDDAVMTWMHS